MVIAEYNMSHIDTMDGHEFEHFIAALLRKLGYQKVEVTRGSGDQGVDVLAEKDDIRYAVQCKCYTTDLGNTPVQEVNTGKMVYQCHVGVVITNRYFTQSAKEAAKATGVLLWDRAKLGKMIAQAQAKSDLDVPIQQRVDSLILWSGSPLLKRGGIALKDKEWKKAIQFFDRVLNTDPENAEAYLGLVMAKGELSDKKEFMEAYGNRHYILDQKNLNHVKEFAGPELSAWFAQADKLIKEKEKKALEEKEKKRKEDIIRLAPIRDSLKKVTSPIVTGGSGYIIGLKADGTVVAAGDNQYGQCNVSGWQDIVAVAGGACHTVGLKADGTVVATGTDRYSICNVSGWQDIVAVACSHCSTVGLKADGTVLITSHGESNRYLSGWQDIVAVAGGTSQIVGLKSNGTVVIKDESLESIEKYGEWNVSDWQDIVTVACGYSQIVGLKSNGTAVAMNRDGEIDVSDWQDIVAVVGGNCMGLKSDGTVVARKNYRYDSKWIDIVDITELEWGPVVGLKSDGIVVVMRRYLDDEYDVSGWTDVVAVTVAGGYIVGLKADGSVVVAGTSRKRVHRDLSNILEWDLLNNLDILKQRQTDAKAHLMSKAEAKCRQQAALRTELNMKKMHLNQNRLYLERS